MTTIKAFTAKEPDICVKCGEQIKIGDEISWLRDAERVGYFHPEERDKETIMALTKVRVTDPTAQLGWRWIREKDRGVPGMTAIFTPVLPVLTVSRAGQSDEKIKEHVQITSLPAAVETVSDSFIVQAVAKAVMPMLRKMITEVKGPRIVVNVYVNKSGDEIEALETLSKELATYSNVR